MAVEIAQLVLRGSFGPGETPKPDAKAVTRAQLDRLRREMRVEMRDLIDEALRRQRER